MINRDAQENFRLSYRNKIANWYNGYLHIAIIFGIGFSLLFIYLQYIDQPSIFDFLTIPITFIAANFFEWYLHKVIMHKPQKKIGLRAIYQRHNHNHHNSNISKPIIIFFYFYFFTLLLMLMWGGELVSSFVSSSTTCTQWRFIAFCCNVGLLINSILA